MAEFVDARELTWNLTLRELRGRYKKSILGWTWSLLNPLSTVIIFSIVFSFFLKITPPKGNPSGLVSFPLFLLCGLLAWNFIANGMSTSLSALTGNASLIKKVYFPREMLVVATIGSVLVSLLIEISVLSTIMLIFGNMVLPWLPMVLVLVALQTAFVLGIGLVLAVTNVYFRDVQHLVSIALQALFYSAPIVYPIRYVPDTANLLGMSVPVGTIYRLNPIVTFVQSYRDLLYNLRMPPIASLGYLVVWAVGSVTFGLWLFRRLNARLAEEV